MTLTAHVAPYGGLAGVAVCRGRDQRGWAMIDVYPSQKIDGKPLELVSQPGEIVRIYVNPHKEAFDEMETPPGCGTRLEVKLYPFRNRSTTK